MTQYPAHPPQPPDGLNQTLPTRVCVRHHPGGDTWDVGEVLSQTVEADFGEEVIERARNHRGLERLVQRAGMCVCSVVSSFLCHLPGTVARQAPLSMGFSRQEYR